MTLMHDSEVIVFGAGGHGKVVADIVLQCGWTCAGFVDDQTSFRAAVGLPLSILGDRTWLCNQPRDTLRVALGIGDNYGREAVASFLTSAGIEVVSAISPFAVVSPSAQIGAGTVIMPGAVVNAMAIVGEGVIINSGAVVEHDTRVGNYVHLSPNSTLGGGVEIGEFSHLGLGASVLPLIRIGSRSILGAGSVVTGAIPDNVIAFGVPARIKRHIISKTKRQLV
jgi:sugar O-acyltransferase (sialic acid O-acetyltransferase NeuD family)